MGNSIKRFLAMALAIVMVVGMMPSVAFAAETTNVAKIGETEYASLSAAITAATAGQTITLIGDVNESVTISKKVTIDGAGKTYTGKMTLKADTTIKNVNFDGKGYNGYAVETRGANYLTIEDCTAKNYGYGFVQLPSATVLTTVKNVTISNMNYGVKVDYSNAVVLENVDITANVAAVLNSNYGEKTITIKDSKLNILGTWTRDNTTKTTYVFEGENTVGEFKTDAAIDNFKLASGATLTAPEGQTIITDVADHEVAYNEGVYSVVETAKPVAFVNGEGYKTLADALAAAQAGDTIIFLADITEDVTISKKVTIDGAGKTYTGKMTLKADTTIKKVNFDGKGYNGYAVETRGANNVTIEDCTAKNYGYGFLQLASGTVLTTVKNVTISDMNYGVKVDYSNAVVLENVDIAASVAAVLNSNYGEKTITIKNSKLNILGTWTRNNTTKTTYVFEGENTVGQFKTDAAIDNFKLASGATLTAPNTITATATEEGYEVVYENGTYSVVKVVKPVAKIGSTNYSTLAEAVAAAKAGQTITLLRNAKGPGVIIDKNLTIDFAGYTYTLTSAVGSTGTESNGFQILKGNKVLLKKGTLKVADEAADKFYILVQNYADLEVFNMTLDGTNLDKWSKTDGDSYTLSNNSGTVSLTGSTKIIANNDGDLAFAFDVCDKTAWGYELPTVKVVSTVKVEGAVEAVAKVGTVYYATLQQAVDAASAGGTVTLVRSCSGAGVVINKNITINFNGFTYTLTSGVGSTGTESNGFQILKGNKVILQKGTLEVAASAADKFYILVQNYANLEVFNMTLDGTNLDKWSKTDGDSYTLSNNSGEVKLTGSTKIIANDEGDLAFAFDVCDKTAWGYTLPTVTVASTVKIVGAIEAPVKVGRVYYATFEAGYEAVVNDNDILYLASDLHLTEKDVVKTADGLNVMFVFDKNVTFNFNGHTIYVDYDSSELLYAVMYVADGVTVSFVDGNDDKGGIELTTGDTLAGKYDCVAYMFWKRGTTGNMYIIGGTYHANKVEDSMVYTNGNTKVTVKRGTFILDNVGSGANGSPWIFNTKGQNENKIVIMGGSFNTDVFHQYWIFETQVSEKLALQYDEETGLYKVVDAVAYVAERYKFSTKWYTKKVGYATVADAYAVANAKGWEVTLLSNNVESFEDFSSGHASFVLENDITTEKVIYIRGTTAYIDLNGKTVTATGGHVFGAQGEGCVLNINGEGTVQSGTGFVAFASSNGVLNINGGTYQLSATKVKAHIYVQNSAHVVINGGSFISSDADTPIAYCINGYIEITGGFFQNTANPKQALLSMGNSVSYVNNQKITLSGGTFVNWNPMESAFAKDWPQAPAMIVLAEGYTIVSETQANGDIWYTVVAE